MKKRGIYIHVPFCRSKCPYCDFYSIPDHDDELRARYTDAVCKEIEYYGIRCNDKKIESIYFGGGHQRFCCQSNLQKSWTASETIFN